MRPISDAISLFVRYVTLLEFRVSGERAFGAARLGMITALRRALIAAR